MDYPHADRTGSDLQPDLPRMAFKILKLRIKSLDMWRTESGSAPKIKFIEPELWVLSKKILLYVYSKLELCPIFATGFETEIRFSIFERTITGILVF